MDLETGTTRAIPVDGQVVASHLGVLDGPAAGTRKPLGLRLLVGRSARCNLVLPGGLVSRTHAEEAHMQLHRHGDRLRAELL